MVAFWRNFWAKWSSRSNLRISFKSHSSVPFSACSKCCQPLLMSCHKGRATLPYNNTIINILLFNYHDRAENSLQEYSPYLSKALGPRWGNTASSFLSYMAKASLKRNCSHWEEYSSHLNEDSSSLRKDGPLDHIQPFCWPKPSLQCSEALYFYTQSGPTIFSKSFWSLIFQI